VKQMDERLDRHLMTMEAQVRTIFDEGFAQIKSELNDEQRKRLDALRERMERHKDRPASPDRKPPSALLVFSPSRRVI